MKNILLFAVALLLLASCSTPKYAYYFDHYDYNSGKKKSPVTDIASNFQSKPVAQANPLLIDQPSLVASTEANVVSQPINLTSTVDNKSLLNKKYSSLSKEEKKAFRAEVKTAIKDYKKLKKDMKSGNSVKETQVMDYNLKMAIIFGAVALTLSFFGGVNSIFWIVSVVALVVGVVFFIKWIAEQ
jgi:hypothetical protein